MLSHSCFDGHLSCFQLLPTMNKAVVTFMSNSFCGHIFPFLLDKCLRVNYWIIWYLFNFIKNCQNVFPKSCTILYNFLQHIRASGTPYAHQYWILLVILILLFYYEVASHCTLMYSPLKTHMILSIFSCVY